MGYTSVRKCIHIQIEIRNKFNLIREKERSGETVSIICKRYGIFRKTYYRWNNRYRHKGIEGLSDLSRRPHNIGYRKVTSEIEETILDLRLTKRFGCNRIRFRLKRIVGLSLSTKIRSYKRFSMKHPNDMVQMHRWISLALSTLIIPVRGITSIISCLDDCSRKVASRWSKRKTSVVVLNVLEDWIMINGKPHRIMHDNGKQFISNIFKHFLAHNHIKDKRIPNSYPQLQGKIEAHNKIVYSVT